MAEVFVHTTATRVAAPTAATTLPFISVMVPVRNEERYISRLLDALVSQDYPPDRFEVLVADGRSTDATRELVRAASAEYENVRLIDNPGRLSSAGRNAAVRAARGDVLLLIDGHCDLNDRRYLREIAEAFARSAADCLGRPQPLDVSEATPLQRAIALARASRLGHNPSSPIFSTTEGFVAAHSVAIAYKRSVFEQIGHFDERFDACEDVELNHRIDRAGLRCYFTPRIALRYHPRGTLTGLFRQMARYGRGRMRLLRKHPDTFSVGCFLPAAFVLGVAIGPLVAMLTPWLAALYLGSLGLYGAIILAVSLALALRARDARLLPWLPCAFAAIHVGSGFGVVAELLLGLFRRTGRCSAASSPVPQGHLG